jgi:hypothetical protein
MTMASDEGDVVAWARQQARLLRTGQCGALDIEHIGFDTLPADCPWTAAEVLDTGFGPGVG